MTICETNRLPINPSSQNTNQPDEGLLGTIFPKIHDVFPALVVGRECADAVTVYSEIVRSLHKQTLLLDHFPAEQTVTS